MVSIRKLDPLSDGRLNTLWLIGPTVPPLVRKTDIMAGGRLQVGAPSKVSVNFTGTAPRLTLNTDEPSALMGGWMVAVYADSKMANGDREVTPPQITLLVVSSETVTFTQAPPSK